MTLSNGELASLKPEVLLELLLGCTLKPLQHTMMVASAEADARIVIALLGSI